MKEITVAAKKECMDEVIDLVEAELADAGAARKDILKIHMVVDEILNNIASYAYEDEGDVKVVIDHEEDSGMFSLIFYDSGIPYDPLSNEDPDTTLSARERPVGGLGILMVKKTMDETHYENRDGMNILTLKKKIGGDHA